MKGFFDDGFPTMKKEQKFSMCGACGLHETCKTPRMSIDGAGHDKILIVGEAPGATEDEEGRPFVGKAGKYLKRILGKIGCNIDYRCWITNAVLCRPPNNQTPTKKQLDYCRPNLIKNIERLRPKVIITLGASAVETLTNWLWGGDFGTIGRWVNWQIPCQEINVWLCPSYHPSFAVRQDDPVLDRMIENDLKQAIKIEERPWNEPPNFERKIEICFQPESAAEILRGMIEYGQPVAFDFETNMLKPDSPRARIATCAVCQKGRTIAYPMRDEAVGATVELLESPLAKIAANMKFEDRWSRAVLQCRVRNWHWDTMLAQHVLDNRPNICGLKFMSFVYLGQRSYDDRIKPYLESTKTNGTNRVFDAPLRDLLVYNGMDALLEYEIAIEQMGKLQFRR